MGGIGGAILENLEKGGMGGTIWENLEKYKIQMFRNDTVETKNVRKKVFAQTATSHTRKVKSKSTTPEVNT